MVGARTLGARLGHGRGKDPKLLGARWGQGWGMVGAKNQITWGRVGARLGQGWGMVGHGA